MNNLDQLLQLNQKWAEGVTNEDPQFFENLSKGQSPTFLWIGCADSRVPATQVCQKKPGDLFVHRNIANLVIHSDTNSMSVIQYAVQYLQVQEVIVCGHYGCGGVAAALSSDEFGPIDHWLRHIKDGFHHHREELEKLSGVERLNRMVEINVKNQVANLCHNSIIQKAWQQGQTLNIHGLVYDLSSGLLKDLKISQSSSKEMEPPYLYQS